ncbi:hypothetical protein Sste5346_004357 [Sporothrix stenoceras]|uniref:Uncharacterized protein n=1 Tax=Sporothrix stenoceras TaxID=5173 RepID=A0ABR3ZA95_9PEZI
MAGSTAKPIDFLQLLDDSDRRLFFFALDYVTECITHNGNLPPENILDGLTNKKHITDYVTAYAHTQDRDTLRKNVAALQAWKPLFLAVPPGQATGHRISTSGPVNKTDAPLSGSPLLDGRAAEWTVRLKEKSDTYFSDTSSPLILNYYEARQIRAEYASRDFKSVSPERGSDFPNSIEEQQKLVAKLYDAILNMDNILERKRPISLKKSCSDDSSDNADIDTSGPTSPRKRKASHRDEGDDDVKDTVENDTLEKKGDTPSKPVPQQKETISVTKVKGLSRIEVEMLSWEILYTIRDVDRGQVPFMHWSGRDWGWDSQFATFLERFEAVATTLRRSKAAVCSLLESDYMARLAAHPRREYRRKENNRSQNAERNAQVFVGRHAIGTGQVQVGQTGDLQDRDGNVVAAAGTVHSGLIEQTRKLGEMSSRRDSAAKRAKITGGSPSTTSPESTNTADTEGAATTKAPSPKASQKKTRVRSRKIAAKTHTTTADIATKVPAGASAVGNSSPKQGQSTSDNMSVGSADLDTFIPTLSAPFSWSHASNSIPASTTAPSTPFSTQTEWPSTFSSLLPGTESYHEFSHGNTGFSPNKTDLPSVVSDFSLLNSNANLHHLNMAGGNAFTLPFRPALSANTDNNRSTNETAGNNSTSAPDSPSIVSDAPMEDIFSMIIAINTSANGGVVTAENNNANNQPTVPPPQLLAHTPMTSPQWANADEVNMNYQMALLNSDPQNVLGVNYTPQVNGTSPSSGTDLDWGMFTVPYNTWVFGDDSGSVDFGDNSNPSQADSGEI